MRREGRTAQRGRAQRAAGSISRSRAPQLSGGSRRPAVGFSPSRLGGSWHGPGPTAPRDVRGPERLSRHPPPVTSRPQLAGGPARRLGAHAWGPPAAASGPAWPGPAPGALCGPTRELCSPLPPEPGRPSRLPPGRPLRAGASRSPRGHRRLPWPWGCRRPTAAPGGRQPPPACCGICAAVCLG